MPAPLVWDFKITGADEVKRQLQDVASSTRVAKSDSVEYSKSLRDQARDANLVIREDEYRARIMVAAHPILRNAIQSASMLTSVTRNAVAVENMWNTAMLLSRGTTADVVAAQDELKLAKMEYSDLVRRGLGDSIQGQLAKEIEIGLEHKLAEATKAAGEAQLNAAFNFITGGAQIAGAIVQILPKMITMASGAVVMGTTYTGALASMSTATSVFGITADAVLAAAPWLALIAVVAVVAYYMITHWSEVVGFFNTYLLPTFQAVGKVFSNVGKFIAENWRTLLTVLTLGTGALVVFMIDHWQDISNGLSAIWTGMQKGFVALWNGFATVANAGIGAITKGIQYFVNGAVDALNVLIGAYNAAVSLVGGRGINLISHVSFAVPQIPLIKAAAGFDGIVNSPTVFVAGEAGQSERVRIGAPSMSGGSGGGMTINNITVQGNVWTERELTDRVLRVLDEMLRDRGFQ